MSYFWKKITSNTRGACKDIINVHNELAILSSRRKELDQESYEISERWRFIQRSCKHNSDSWSQEKRLKYTIGLSGPCQHPEQSEKSRIGNCFSLNCPLTISEEY
ncbi:MAG: hypothetical protein ACFFG0_04000 [Candidatus Thorarchaeota archaeon]